MYINFSCFFTSLSFYPFPPVLCMCNHLIIFYMVYIRGVKAKSGHYEAKVNQV